VYESADLQNGYDKLAMARQEAFDILAQQQNEDNTVEKRIKSPSPKSEGNGPLSPPLTDTEISHLKTYNKEPLVNTSATVHNRRNAEYVTIDLPDTASESTDSRPGSELYDVLPSRSEQFDSSQLYDVPRSSIYSVPRSSLNVRESMLQRALPHLPTDYVNVRLDFDNDDMYSEIPHTNNTKSTQELVNDNIHRPYHDDNAQSNDDTPLKPGQKLAQELAEEEGYVLVNPATLPALKSPPIVIPPRHQSVPDNDDDDDEYIIMQRSTNAIKSVQPPNKDVLHHEYVNVPNKDSVKRNSDGYEEVSEIREWKANLDTAVDLHDLSLSSSEITETNDDTEHTSLEQHEHNLISMSSKELTESENTSTASNAPPIRTLSPVAFTFNTNHISCARKRSLTVGDALDANKDPKKHTYVNIPNEQLPGSSLPPRANTDSCISSKKPMPLPRPSLKISVTSSLHDVVCDVPDDQVTNHHMTNHMMTNTMTTPPPPSTINTNSNNNSNCQSKVKTLIRQFSE
jgi:hypothetical protein